MLWLLIDCLCVGQLEMGICWKSSQFAHLTPHQVSEMEQVLNIDFLFVKLDAVGDLKQAGN
jgi:hypothetical protein